MSDRDDTARDLDSAIADLYGGPLADFIRGRDALAKNLRTSGDRAAATAVKALRKPSRLAWALNLGTRSRQAFGALETAIAGTLDAQVTGGDVRAAMAALREAVRSVASVCADASQREGHAVEARALSNAMLAVISTPESFEQLRRGQLADVPDAGGLDFLDSLPAPTGSLAPVTAGPTARKLPQRTPPEQATGDDAAAQANALRAFETLNAARARATAADELLRTTESELASAEERARQANRDLETARQRRDRARSDAETASAELRTAVAANAEAQKLLKQTVKLPDPS